MIKLSIIIPCHNEQQRIADTFEVLRDFFQMSKKFKGEIVFVDDGSTDDTLKVLCKLVRGQENVKVLTYRTNMGKGFAVRQGLLNSRYYTKLILDADLSIDVHHLNAIDFRKRWHIVKARRRFTGEPLTRKILSWSWHQIVLFYLRLDYDTQSPFMLLRLPRKFYRNLTIDGFSFDCEILYKAHKKRYIIREKEMPYLYESGSKVTVRKALLMLEELRKIKK